MEARSSGDLSLARWISMIESSGFGSSGENPVANLDVLTKPREPHLRKWFGMVGSCCCWSFRRFGLAEEWVVKVRFKPLLKENNKVLDSLDDRHCILRFNRLAGSFKNFIEQLSCGGDSYESWA